MSLLTCSGDETGDAEPNLYLTNHDLAGIESGAAKELEEVIPPIKAMRLRPSEFPMFHDRFVGGVKRNLASRLQQSPRLLDIVAAFIEKIDDVDGENLVDRLGRQSEIANIAL